MRFHNPELNKHIVSLDQYYVDLANGTLPAVSYIVPSGASEHPPGSIQAGERFVRAPDQVAFVSGRAWIDQRCAISLWLRSR